MNYWVSLVPQMVKNLPANVGDLGSIPGLEDHLEGTSTHSSILAWRILMDRGAGGGRYGPWGVTKNRT